MASNYGAPMGGMPPSGNFHVYQLDFAAQAVGKRVASTKRRIRWRFGFSNQEALDAGQTGMACRGEEHDVTLVWSITSGKRQIMMDGQEVNYSATRASIVDFSWPMKGNHVIKVTAHANPPISTTPGFRQYDLMIDGQSFFHLPKVFELGIKGGPPAHSRIPGVDVGGGYQAARGPPRSLASQEEADLQRAIQESIAESQKHLGRQSSGYSGAPAAAPAPPAPAADLLNFAEPVAAAPPAIMPAPVPPPAAYPPPAAPMPYAAAPVPPPAAPGALVAYGAPPPQPPAPFASPESVPPAYSNPLASPAPTMASAPPPQQYAAPPVAPPAPAPVPGYAADPFTKYDDPFAPKAAAPPTQTDVHNHILGAYGGAPPTPQANGVPPQPNFSTPQHNGTTPVEPATDAAVVGNGPSLSMNAPLALTAEPEGPPKSELEKAMNNLVNFDDINEPAEKEMKLTFQKEEVKKDPMKSKPIAPVASNMVGSGASLAQIQSVKPNMAPKDPQSIMKPPPQLFHPDAVNAGALVIHGQPAQGAPPLQQNGFGVGYGAPPPSGYGYSPYGQGQPRY